MCTATHDTYWWRYCWTQDVHAMLTLPNTCSGATARHDNADLLVLSRGPRFTTSSFIAWILSIGFLIAYIIAIRGAMAAVSHCLHVFQGAAGQLCRLQPPTGAPHMLGVQRRSSRFHQPAVNACFPVPHKGVTIRTLISSGAWDDHFWHPWRGQQMQELRCDGVSWTTSRRQMARQM